MASAAPSFSGRQRPRSGRDVGGLRAPSSALQQPPDLGAGAECEVRPCRAPPPARPPRGAMAKQHSREPGATDESAEKAAELQYHSFIRKNPHYMKKAPKPPAETFAMLKKIEALFADAVCTKKKGAPRKLFNVQATKAWKALLALVLSAPSHAKKQPCGSEAAGVQAAEVSMKDGSVPQKPSAAGETWRNSG